MCVGTDGCPYLFAHVPASLYLVHYCVCMHVCVFTHICGNSEQPLVLSLWQQWSCCLAPSPRQIGGAADGGYQIPTASLSTSFTVGVRRANPPPVSQEVFPVKPRLNQINSHVQMIRPYPIVNYPEHGGVDGSGVSGRGIEAL